MGAGSRGRGWLLFTSIFLVLGYTSSDAIAQSTSKAALLTQAKGALVSALEQLDEVGKDLDRKKAAHLTFSKYIDKSMPEAFVRGLNIEISILVQVIKTNNLVGEVVMVANQLAAGQPLNTNFSEVGEKLSEIDDGLKQLQDTLQSHRAARQSFKLRLDQIINSLIAARPGDANTLLSVGVELDPQSLDLELVQQRTVLASTIIMCNALK
ncbi:MAG TPA: hypothetical protein VFW53_05770 [Gallionella sp.]|nr:hypothetical protein [Gallionella sp.]